MTRQTAWNLLMAWKSCFSQKSRTMDSIPPTEDAILQHYKWVIYLEQQWHCWCEHSKFTRFWMDIRRQRPQMVPCVDNSSSGFKTCTEQLLLLYKLIYIANRYFTHPIYQHWQFITLDWYKLLTWNLISRKCQHSLITGGSFSSICHLIAELWSSKFRELDVCEEDPFLQIRSHNSK